MRKLTIVGGAILAAVLFSGGALAATRYVITSKHQIKPSVFKQLHGDRGRRGATGKRGARGTRGTRGARGFVGAKGSTGATGPGGATGATGATGPVGGFSAANVTEVPGPTVTLTPSSVAGSLATCPAGSVVLGGGYQGTSSPPVDATAADDGPLDNVAWDVVIANNSTTQTAGFTTYAICAAGSGSQAQARSARLADAAKQATANVGAAR